MPPLGKRSLLPHEHGAYGQIVLPLIAGLALGRPGPAATLLSLAAFSGFLAYEPLLVAAGHRGVRSREGDASRARRWAASLLALAAAFGTAGFALAPAAARWAALVCPLLAGVVAVLVWRDAERTAVGEMVVATALSSTGYPVALAAGAPLGVAAAAWIAWILAFASATLAVQAVLARRNPSSGVAWGPATAIAAILAFASSAAARTSLPWAVPAAVAPVALAALGIVLLRVPPRQLRRVGWAVLSASLVSLAVLVGGLR